MKELTSRQAMQAFDEAVAFAAIVDCVLADGFSEAINMPQFDFSRYIDGQPTRQDCRKMLRDLCLACAERLK